MNSQGFSRFLCWIDAVFNTPHMFEESLEWIHLGDKDPGELRDAFKCAVEIGKEVAKVSKKKQFDNYYRLAKEIENSDWAGKRVVAEGILWCLSNHGYKAVVPCKTCGK